jgi:hypothetical protein
MSAPEEQAPQVVQGGGTDGLTGAEFAPADETVPRPDLDPDAWDAKPADEEPYHPPASSPDERGFAGEDEGSTEGGPPPGAR